MLILDAIGQVDAVRQAADLRFDDVRSGGRTVRHVPFVLPVEEGRLFLGPRQRDPKLLIGAETKQIALQSAWGGFSRATFEALFQSHADKRRSPEAAEGLASFAEKRAAKWT